MAERYIRQGTYPDPVIGEILRGAFIPSPRLEAPFPAPRPTALAWYSYAS
jgi:hypothetical protein